MSTAFGALGLWGALGFLGVLGFFSGMEFMLCLSNTFGFSAYFRAARAVALTGDEAHASACAFLGR